MPNTLKPLADVRCLPRRINDQVSTQCLAVVKAQTCKSWHDVRPYTQKDVVKHATYLHGQNECLAVEVFDDRACL